MTSMMWVAVDIGVAIVVAVGLINLCAALAIGRGDDPTDIDI